LTGGIIKGRPVSALHGGGELTAPRSRFPEVPEAAPQDRPRIVIHVTGGPATEDRQRPPIQTVDGPGASRNMMIQATMKRET
jgi:hypothetical protein